MRLSVEGDGSVSGEQSVGEVTSPEDPGLNTFSGIVEGQTLLINLWNIFNQGATPITWNANPQEIDTGYLVYDAVDCQSVALRFPQSGPKADLKSDSSLVQDYGPTASDVLGWADEITVKPVQFAPGATGVEFEDQVRRHEVIVYEIEAQAGQYLWAELRIHPDSVMLSILSPSGEVLARDEEKAGVLLPSSGVYQVAVAGNPGFNTSVATFFYDLILDVR
ncbi:MAG: hypothetical protein JJU32_19530 [Phormidium sp. BM_Day4_Bin.17]|nr:hypothetical protein [Phormidium sp. BM_Day4_Bin.17]